MHPMTRPFLSICIMTFNRRRTLGETLDSILPQIQRRVEVEVVICDNASEDDTTSFVQSYLDRYPNLRYHRNESNFGIDGNVITCVKQARGEYVAFFSDDDIAPPKHVDALLEELESKKPCILYINHTPFFHNDVTQLSKPQSPYLYREFTDGQDFVMQAGLGFISSLIVNREKALPFLTKVTYGACEAHLDIACRMALTCPDLFVYNGLISVYARCDYGASPILIFGCVNIAKLYQSLVEERLLDSSVYQNWLRKQVRVIPRHLFVARGQNQHVYPLRGMINIYGGVMAFYFLVLPLYLIPTALVAILYRWGRVALHTFRRIVYMPNPQRR